MKIKLLFAALAISQTMMAQQPAFPEARGWGRFATGGRYGSVYHVTNLNDSGAGSLRDAVSQKNRIIVFDVAGVINISSRMVFSSNLYVAGQTAPGEGITVYGDGVSFSGASNIICRYMRFRMGAGGASGKDCAGVANGTNMIFDHCSFAWGRDETFSINPDGKGDLHSITLQNCIVGQGLMSHSAGGLIQADSITLYRNFYCDNSTRNNKVKGRNQYVNCLVYNWKDGAYIMGGDSEGTSYCNIVGNLFINGPSGGGAAFTGGNGNFHCYVKDNWQDSNKNGRYDPAAVTTFSASDVVSKPYNYPELEAWEATSLPERLLPTVGASLPYRDYVDYYMVDEVLTYGTSGALISNEGSLVYGTPNTWTVWQGNKRQDSDGDGMPDEWEKSNGLNPSVNDAMKMAANGYCNIENYINSLTVDDRDFYLRPPLCLEQIAATTTTMQLRWRDYTYGEEGFVVECRTEGGDFIEVARTSADQSSVTLRQLTPGTAYAIRVKAFSGDNFSEYSKEVTLKTRPEEVGIVDIDTYEPEAVWTPAVPTWDATTTGWQSADGLYADGRKVLIGAQEDAEITLSESVQPATVVVNTDADVKLSGTGDIAGETSLNKAGSGRLTVATKNSYTGATVLHDGTLSFSLLKDGGVVSGLGASQEFAQNWVFDGGTYEYTGGSTSTNRCAKLLSEGTLAISKAASVVKMNGTFEGGANFVLAGKGNLTINTTNFFGYTGSTILQGGTLFLSTPEIAAAGIGKSRSLVFAGGTLQTKGETEGYETYSFPMEVREGTTSQFSPNRNCYMKSTVTGSGTLQLNIPYVREYIQGNWEGFTGRLIGNGAGSGQLFLLSGKNIPNAVVVLKNGARACGWDTSGDYTLGGLSGDAGTYLSGSSKQTNGFTCKWTIGRAGTDETFRGIINNWSCSGSGHVGTVNIVKEGTGVWRLTGANEYSGTTTVNGGRLVVNGAHSGTGLITVNRDATLAGTGSLAGAVSIKAGANIYAGDTLLTGRNTLTVKGKLTVASAGAVTIPVSFDGTTVKTNRLVLSGGATFTKATLCLEFKNVYTTLDIPVGTEFQLFVPFGTMSGSFTDIQPASPGEGRIWDTTDLVKKGILRVITDPEADGIHAVRPAGKKDSSARLYDLSGRPTTGTTKGLVISDGKLIMKR